MVQNYKEISRSGRRTDPRFKIGTALVDSFVDSLRDQKLLPDRFQELQIDSKNERFKDLDLVVNEYKTQPHTPELITNIWQAIWQAWGRKVGLNLTVPSCDRTQEELTQLEKDGKRMIYVPQEVATQENRYLFDKIFPKMQDHNVTEENLITNDNTQEGWLDIEVNPDAPNRRTTEENLREQFVSREREGQSLSSYIIGSQLSKLVTDCYFDEDTASRLLNSRMDGDIIGASFHPSGYLRIHWRLDPGANDSYIGGRSVGRVKKI